MLKRQRDLVNPTFVRRLLEHPPCIPAFLTRDAALQKAARSRYVWSKSVKRQVQKRGMDVAECQIMNRFFGSLSRDSLAR